MPPLWWAAVVAAGAYLGATLTGRKGWTKVLPAGLLAGAVAPSSPIGALALVACAAGDGFLLDKDRYFLHGLAAFLVGHGLFVPALLLQRHGEPPTAFTAVVLVAAATMLAVIVPRLAGTLRLAVPIYAAALAAMAIAASAHSTLAAAGALVFVGSDALLALNRFVRPLPRAELLVLSTYYAALLALSASLVEGG